MPVEKVRHKWGRESDGRYGALGRIHELIHAAL